MSMVELYLLTRLDEINSLFVGILIISVACLVLAMVGYASLLELNEMKEARICRTFAIVSAIFSLTSGFGLIFVPSEKDVAIIYAGHWATTNEEVTKLPENVGKFLNHYLEEVSDDD